MDQTQEYQYAEFDEWTEAIRADSDLPTDQNELDRLAQEDRPRFRVVWSRMVEYQPAMRRGEIPEPRP